MNCFVGQKYKTKKGEKSPRKLRPRCSCTFAQRQKKLRFTSISEEVRQSLFTKFWKLSWPEKRTTVQRLVDKTMTKDLRNRKDSEKSRRQSTFMFHLRMDNERVRVCKKMFMNTLGLNEWSVRNWASGNISSIPKEMPTRKLKSERKRTSVRMFLDALPKMESHYCRKSTSKQYLEPIFTSHEQLYKEYKKYCKENGIDEKKTVHRTTFNDVMNDLNIKLFSPKKDQCDTCVAHTAKNVSDEEWNEHIGKKNRARAEKESDKIKTKHVYTMDVQAVLLCSRMQASALYYKTKLTVHNFTIYNLKNNAVHCYLWNETEGDLSANVFASMLHDFIEKKN